MELRQLKHFIAVAEELHFTRAAARVHVVQSTLSASISGLEKELGTALLVRSSRRVDLTAAGRALLPSAQRTLAAADAARAAVDGVRGLLRGDVAIGSVQGLSIIDLPRRLGQFHRRHPHISLSLRHNSIDTLVQATADGDLDLAFVSRPYDASRVQEFDLGEEVLTLIVSRDDPLAGTDVVALADLRDHEFVERRADFTTRVRIDKICAELGFQRIICAESDTPADLIDLVGAGLGIAFLPPVLLRDTDHVICVQTEPPIRREMTLIIPGERPPSPASAALLAELGCISKTGPTCQPGLVDPR